MRDDPALTVALIVMILGSVALHEFAHAKSADIFGDPTPRIQGRVTLNPVRHLDPIGTVMIIVTVMSGYGIGWGKPVQVDPRKMQHPRLDHFLSVLWGPLTNVIIAVAFAGVYHLLAITGVPVSVFVAELLFYTVAINLGLAAFNLLPIGPLDGHWLLGLLMPPELGYKFMRWSQGPGTLVLLVLVLGLPLFGVRPLAAYYNAMVLPVVKLLFGQ